MFKCRKFIIKFSLAMASNEYEDMEYKNNSSENCFKPQLDSLTPDELLKGENKLLEMLAEYKKARLSKKFEIVNESNKSDRKIYNNRYQTVTILGEGSFAQVVLVYDTIKKDYKAIKEVTPQTTTSFVSEDDVLSLLQKDKQHPNIIRLFESFHTDFFSTQSPLCLVMEYAPYGDLTKRIESARSDPNKQISRFGEVLPWTSQLVEALCFVHDLNIIHRDIKPCNILLFDENVVKLADFGCVKINVKSDTIVGTRPYMSPEQLRGTVYDAKTDIWSLGCVLYELVTLNALNKDASSDPIIPEISEETFGNVCLSLRTMLKKNPEERFTANRIKMRYFK